MRVVLFLLLALALFPAYGLAREAGTIPRELLVEDIRQLAELLETAHPDPYVRGGGKVAFHRRLHDTLEQIPDDGLDADSFYRLLQPFIAAVRDGHTALRSPVPPGGGAPGLPLDFRVVEKDFVVARVYDEAQRPLLGARLVAIDGVMLAELVERQAGLRGWDNPYSNLEHLRRSLTLATGLRALIPQRGDRGDAELELLDAADEPRTVTVALTGSGGRDPIRPASAVELPSTERSDQAFGFLDSQKSVAILRIDSMGGYREAYELNVSNGFTAVLDHGRRIYQRYHGDAAPQDTSALLAGLPSATELFREMATAMKEAATETLVVDLRRNDGGNSVMAAILLYFLYGKEAAAESGGGYQIKKYSDLYFANYSTATLETINRGERRVPLQRDDYDFRGEHHYRAERTPPSQEEMERFLRKMPTFFEEYASGDFEAYHRPPRILALSSATTYSAGFDMLVDLYRKGAKIVGTTSSQAGNCFIDSLGFELEHSGLKGSISFKYSLLFPDDPELGEELRPHYELTYDELRRRHFDPNTDVLLALDRASAGDG